MNGTLEKYVEEESIYAVIEALNNCNKDEQTILVAIMEQFNLDEESAKQYYDELSH